ncbi:MAG: PcfJ domain-containing protein [Victivallales bacterium]|nr:PcfJ domain-containing protein [Victivallales bacterium]
MKYKAYNVTWKCRGYGVDPHRLEKYMVGLEEYRYCKGVRRLGKALELRPDPWEDINEKPRKYRSWKAHSKCRHQWERHEPPAIEGGWSWDEDGSKGDHRRKWVMDCLKKKGVCIFNVHHDKGLENFLENCENWEIRRLGHGLIEATLLVQEAVKPKPKKNPGEKRQSGKSRRRAKHRERIKRRNASILAVKERIRLASRKGSKGVSRPNVPYKCGRACAKKGSAVNKFAKYIAKSYVVSPSSRYGILCVAAFEDHIQGIARRDSPASYLLQNYSCFRQMAKTRLGLDEYDQNYKLFHTVPEQCCVWLTGRRVSDFPAWCMGMLTEARLAEDIAKRLWNWMLGITSVRDVYGLSKNEAHEIFRLPASINNENEAIVAAIAASRHCDETLAMNLTKQIPSFGRVVNDHARCSFVRKLVEWLIAVNANPIAGKLHDLLDYFFRSGIWRDSEFSFKGRTLQRVEQLMREWHQDYIEHGGMSREEFLKKWDKHDFDCNVKLYQFQELLSAGELLAEGKRQHNCVFSYRDLCRSGMSSIVSMRGVENLTLEIRARCIVQIRGVCNRLPYPEEMRVIRQYASLKNLTIA